MGVEKCVEMFAQWGKSVQPSAGKGITRRWVSVVVTPSEINDTPHEKSGL